MDAPYSPRTLYIFIAVYVNSLLNENLQPSSDDTYPSSFLCEKPSIWLLRTSNTLLMAASMTVTAYQILVAMV